MPFDRFDQIRINPGKETASSDSPDKEPVDSVEKTDDVSPQKKDTSRKRPASSRRRERQAPVIPPKLLLWVAIPLFLALLYGLGTFFLVPYLVKGPISKNLSEYLGRPVTVKRVVFSPFTLRGFMQDVTVGPVYGDTAKTNLLECARFDFRLNFPGLFKKKLICHEVKIDDVKLNIFRLRPGSFSIADAANFLSVIREKSGQAQWPPWLVFDGVLLTDGTVLIDDSQTGKQHRVDQIRFYLPSAAETANDIDASPRLNAVVNSSPVQIDGRRSKNTHGEMETRFNLKFSDIVLEKYLDYIPSVQQNPFHLSGGQADITVSLVIPDIKSDANKVAVQWDADIFSLQYENADGRNVLKVPEAKVTVQALPSENQYIIKNMIFDNPELSIRLKKSNKNQKAGLALKQLNDFILGLDDYSQGLLVENFSVENGTVQMFFGRQQTPKYTWGKGTVHLKGFVNKAALEKLKKEKADTYLLVSGVEHSASEKGKFDLEGKLTEPGRFEGTLSASDINLHQYSPLLPVGVHFAKGMADINTKYMYMLQTDKNKQPVFRLYDGKGFIRSYVFRYNKKTALSGKAIICQDVKVDFDAEDLSCDQVTVTESRIDADRIGLGFLSKQEQKKGKWTFWADNLVVRDSKILKQFDNPVQTDKPVQFEFNKVSMQAVNLHSDNHKGSNLKISAKLGSKGALSLNGTYSLANKAGLFNVDLKDVALKEVGGYFSPWLKPEITSGKLRLEGKYKIPENTFAGNVWINDMKAGSENKPAIELSEAALKEVKVSFNPFTVHCETLSLSQPNISFGLTHSDKPVNMFFKKPDNGIVESYSIQTVRFEKGVFDMPEPVLFQGYQPLLTDLKGSLTSVGSALMDFDIQGSFPDQSLFSIKGNTGTGEVKHYVLDVKNIQLVPFQPLFTRDIGLDVSEATASWQQEMKRLDSGLQVSSKLKFKDIVPVPGSSYFKIAALYTDNENSLLFTSTDEYSGKKNYPFLFDRFIRSLKRESVRADLSEQLVLKEQLPDLELSAKVKFVPGTTRLVVSKALADYEMLLEKRPWLKLLLQANYDPKEDADVLKQDLQQEENARRETENKRRADEQKRIREAEKERLAALKNDPNKIIEERIDPAELSEDLRPLPYKEVTVKPKLLEELAINRAQVLYDFFVKGLLIAPERIQINEQTGTTGAEAGIKVIPYHPSR